MRAVALRSPAGLDSLTVEDRADPGAPGPGELRVALHGSSLNFHDLGGRRGVDHVVEVGGAGTLAQSIEAVRVGGHISLIGVLTGRAGEVPTAALMAKQARLQGLIVGSRRQQQDLVRALDGSGIHPMVDRRFPLEQLGDAFRYEMSGGHFGKIGVEW
jgi:NADPH:quinone reductase-like Zn-dependent oxidoreductase